MLATFADVWVITRENNRAAIEARLPSLAERDSLNFVYVDLPRWARFWKKGQRGIRLYYMLWQLAAARRGRALAGETGADLVWHLTLANAWLGSTAPLLGLPFVYGPVGGAVRPPWRLMAGAPPRSLVFESARAVAVTACRYVNPFARLAWRRAGLILAQNEATRSWMPRRHREKTVLFPHVILEGAAVDARADGPRECRTALFAGRLVFFKRVDLAISAVALVEGWRLIVCGAGPEESRLQALVNELGLSDRVNFLGWTERTRVLELLRSEADVLLFPCLHEEGGMIVGEALANSVPVVCFDLGGPPVVAGQAAAVVATTPAADAAGRFAAVLANGGIPPRSAALRRGNELSREAQGARLWTLLADAGLVGDPSA
jgi:glycosyltransferase involved in cell wall biosynthesis